MKVPYGEADFKAIRTEGYIYIDKTMYIEKLEKNKKGNIHKTKKIWKINVNKYQVQLYN